MPKKVRKKIYKRKNERKNERILQERTSSKSPINSIFLSFPGWSEATLSRA